MADEDDDESPPPIVIDNGSRYIKAGLSGEEYPKAVFPTMIGYPNNTDGNNNYYIGTAAEDKIEELEIVYPFENGVIKYWDDMEKIWSHIFTNELKVNPKERNVLITEVPSNPKEYKKKIAQIMFEKFNVPGLYIANPGVLNIYCDGRFTGFSIDLGDRFTNFTPVFDGFSLPYANFRQHLGGKDLTEYMIKALLPEGYSFFTKSSRLIAEKIKEKACYVALYYEKEISRYVEPFDYELPDGKHVIIRAPRIICPEILFKPDIVGIEVGIHKIEEICNDSIQKCDDIDIRKELYNSIVLAGGTSMFNGLPERLTKEIKALVPESMKEEVKVIAFPERKYAAWIGGSIISSISNFESCWMTKDEYEEYGETIVRRKCFN